MENPENGLDVPAGVTTVKERVPPPIDNEMLISTGKLVSVAPLAMVAVTPVPANVTAEAPLRFVPVMVLDTFVPRTPALGLIDVIFGRLVAPTVNPSKEFDIVFKVASVNVRGKIAAFHAVVIVIGRLVSVRP